MGYIYSPPWHEVVELHGQKKQNTYRYMVLWGKVAKDAELSYTKHKGKPKVEFLMNLGAKQFVGVIVTGDGNHLEYARKLEKGDIVSCMGVWSEKPYFSRTKKEWRSKISFKAEVFFNCFSPTEDGTLLLEEAPDIFESVESGNYDDDILF